MYRNYAENLLKYFVSKSSELYGKEFIVYNVHSLIHLSKEAENFGCLDECSAFAYENYLQSLKKLIRNGRHLIEQIVKKLSEQASRSSVNESTPSQLTSFRKPDNAYVLSNNCCCEVLEPPNASGFVRCRLYRKAILVFTNPCNSSLIGTYNVLERHSRIQLISRDMLKQQAIFICGSNGKSETFLTILHLQ